MANGFVESETSQIYMLARAPSGVELIRVNMDIAIDTIYSDIGIL
jgi:hypothetical protein